MHDKILRVWLDAYGSYEQVGSIEDLESEPAFRYSGSYAGNPVSASLPLQAEPFSAENTAAFFAGLAPEGGMREYFQKILRAEEDEYAKLLERLNDESAGALVFSVGDEPPGSTANYEPAAEGLFEEFASNPTLTAGKLNGVSRLSLTGAMAKIGLYEDPGSGRWHIPFGAAPSTHIVKAGNPAYPHETVNEALCLKTAAHCGFDVPEFYLMDVGRHDPLFVTRRYDRVFPEEPRRIFALPQPARLHQEDMCQALSMPPRFKYEPTDGRYFEKAIGCAAGCGNSFGESMLMAQYIMFDYLIGNADNHLKNYAFLYSSDLSSRSVAPMYDIVSTSAYEGLDLEMGVSFGGSRRITDVTREAIGDAIKRCNLPPKPLLREFDEMAEQVPHALAKARDELIDLGFAQAEYVAGVILEGVEHRRSFDRKDGPKLRQAKR